MGGETLFVSDLHLSPDRPATGALFLDFLARRARAADQLFILGDLFDVWIGDDDDSAFNAQIQSALQALVKAGTACYLMHGNRDFLIGGGFCERTGCQLVPDPSLVHLNGCSTLLMHGDLLCTDDVPYQKFRRRIRHPLVKRLFLWRSLAARRAVAANYRRRSSLATAAKSSGIMDVNAATVESYMQRFGVERLVHGHTHRPADHEILSGARRLTRSVLAEWHPHRGEVLVQDAKGWHREPLLPLP